MVYYVSKMHPPEAMAPPSGKRPVIDSPILPLRYVISSDELCSSKAFAAATFVTIRVESRIVDYGRKSEI
jgi:hypothetical protein